MRARVPWPATKDPLTASSGWPSERTGGGSRKQDPRARRASPARIVCGLSDNYQGGAVRESSHLQPGLHPPRESHDTLCADIRREDHAAAAWVSPTVNNTSKNQRLMVPCMLLTSASSLRELSNLARAADWRPPENVASVRGLPEGPTILACVQCGSAQNPVPSWPRIPPCPGGTALRLFLREDSKSQRAGPRTALLTSPKVRAGRMSRLRRCPTDGAIEQGARLSVNFYPGPTDLHLNSGLFQSRVRVSVSSANCAQLVSFEQWTADEGRCSLLTPLAPMTFKGSSASSLFFSAFGLSLSLCHPTLSYWVATQKITERVGARAGR